MPLNGPRPPLITLAPLNLLQAFVPNVVGPTRNYPLLA